MARDLIPPPSPAGRPQPAGTPRLVELPPEPTLAHLESPPPPPLEPKLPPSRFRNRFGFLTGALAGVVVASSLVLAAVLFWSGGSGAEDYGLASNWSKWQPTDTSIDGGAAQIAEKVGAEYKHPDGKQLVLVQANAIANSLNVALRPASGKINMISGTGIVYELNGLGPNGSIKGGEPSPKRLQVLQREALELALYTFRYLPDVEMVVTLMPPPPPGATGTATSPTNGAPTSMLGTASSTEGEAPKSAIFYRPGDLKQQLQVPLGVTVPAKAPTAETLDATEAKMIDSLTLSNRFVWSLQQGLLVLDRPVNP